VEVRRDIMFRVALADFLRDLKAPLAAGENRLKAVILTPVPRHSRSLLLRSFRGITYRRYSRFTDAPSSSTRLTDHIFSVSQASTAVKKLESKSMGTILLT